MFDTVNMKLLDRIDVGDDPGYWLSGTVDASGLSGNFSLRNPTALDAFPGPDFGRTLELSFVPDTGSTVILLGVGLLGLAAIRRRIEPC